MKTNKRIRVLAEDTRLGNRSSAHQEFRAVVAANGYVMHRGGAVKFGDETVCRGWLEFSQMVMRGDIVLREPAEAEETERETYSREYANTGTTFSETAVRTPLDVVPDHFPYPTPGLIPEVDAIRARRLAETAAEILEAAQGVTASTRTEVTYFYATRSQTIPLTELTEVTVVIQDEADPNTEGECQSGAALNCEGRGFLRVLPESLLDTPEGERIIQCVPCYEASAAAYARKAHRYGGQE